MCRAQGLAGVEHRRGQSLALEVGGRGDARGFQGEHCGRGVVVDHVHGLDRRLRVVRAVLDQRVEVGEADVVGAGGDAGDRAGRAVAGVDGDVQAFFGEVALLRGEQEGRGRAFEAPVEGELQRRGGLGAGHQAGQGAGAEPFAGRGEQALGYGFAHLVLRCHRGGTLHDLEMYLEHGAGGVLVGLERRAVLDAVLVRPVVVLDADV